MHFKILGRFSQMPNDNMLICENIAATLIQTAWMQWLYNCSEFSSMRISSIQTQSFFRGFSVRQILTADQFIAALIQWTFRRLTTKERVFKPWFCTIFNLVTSKLPGARRKVLQPSKSLCSNCFALAKVASLLIRKVDKNAWMMAHASMLAWNYSMLYILAVIVYSIQWYMFKKRIFAVENQIIYNALNIEKP